ncbi:hypothetical protein C9374_002484 [Naegleria lovaniensis]|uniref:RGS domain-containing protein n=1 Tax=Naegleria lovaniensis TaxID=51637 RepID=A0AA88KKF7_NAELO|nr:uncharacterized protein C9374_002484 [Naegleria lovaniensis]KAG2386740.1 hypothetical protein C9374_002484 [Naegleria lovaniensis]
MSLRTTPHELHPSFNNTSPPFNTTESECPEWIRSLPAAFQNRKNPCPETIFVPLITSIFLFVYGLVIMACMIGLYKKRKSGHVQARTTSGMLFTLICNLLCVVSLGVRLIIGRENSPCLLYSIYFFIMPACVTTPTIMRMLRFFIQHQVSLIKLKSVSKGFQQPYDDTSLAQDLNIDLESSIATSMKPSPSPSSTTEKDQRAVERVEQFNTKSFTSTLVQSTKVVEISPPSQPQTSLLKTGIEGINSSLPSSKKALFKMNQLLSSHLFSSFILLSILLIHILIWFVMGVVENNFFENSRFFMKDQSMFSLYGCLSSNSPNIVAVSMFLFYFILELIMGLILLLKTDRDLYNIKREALILIPIQFCVVVLFMVAVQFEIFQYLERIIPMVMLFIFYSKCELFITIFLPICYALVHDYQRLEKSTTTSLNIPSGAVGDITEGSNFTHSIQPQSELEMLLANKESKEILLDYCRRSFCPENVLCYLDIQTYKALCKKLLVPSPKKAIRMTSIADETPITQGKTCPKKQMALHIINTYLEKNSLNELNLPSNFTLLKEQLLVAINAHSEQEMPENLFDSLQCIVLQNMEDVYHRLIRSNVRFKEIGDEFFPKNRHRLEPTNSQV